MHSDDGIGSIGWRFGDRKIPFVAFAHPLNGTFSVHPIKPLVASLNRGEHYD
jgi:hypothetical protein